MGVAATAESLDALLREGRAEFRKAPSLDAASPAAPGEIRRRPAPRHQVGLRAEGRPADRDQGTGRGRAAPRPQPGAARRHRLGQDLHHGEGDRGDAAPRADPRAEQDARRAALWRVQSFFPDNAVEYFVSYYDYYQPEAYVPRTDTYIEKESSINEQIDRMRHSATRALLERDDVVIVASVSCIYGIGSVETYSAMTFALKKGERIDQRQLIADLVALQYKRTQHDFYRGTFRVRGDTLDIFPAHYEDRAWRVNLFGDEVEIDRGVRSAHRAEDRRAAIHQGLRQLALRDAAPDADPGDRRHQGRS